MLLICLIWLCTGSRKEDTSTIQCLNALLFLRELFILLNRKFAYLTWVYIICLFAGIYSTFWGLSTTTRNSLFFQHHIFCCCWYIWLRRKNAHIDICGWVNQHTYMARFEQLSSVLTFTIRLLKDGLGLQGYVYV